MGGLGLDRFDWGGEMSFWELEEEVLSVSLDSASDRFEFDCSMVFELFR